MWITRTVSLAILVVLTVSGTVAVVAGQEGINFSFPSGFRAQDKGNISISGDTSSLGNPLSGNDWYYLNTVFGADQGNGAPSCGRVVYKDKVRMVDNATGTVASFNTAFSFSFQSPKNDTCGDGMVFAFYPNRDIGDLEKKRFGGTFCVFDHNATGPVFAVEIDSYYNWPLDNIPFIDPSDSHIGVDFNGSTKNLTSCPYDANGKESCDYQYNLCPGGGAVCALFCGNESTTYTTWIDYDSGKQLLRVWFTNGSLSTGVRKPAAAIITVPNLPLGEILDDEMYVGFTSSGGYAREVHILQAWEFETSGMPNPSTSPAQNGESRSKSAVAAIAGGVASAGVFVAVVAGLCFYFCRTQPNSFQSIELMSSLEAAETSRTFTFRELSRATKGFTASELLSSGAFGDVYRGTLPSGALVAIKRIKEGKEQGQESFLAEATSLRQIRHRNLLQLRGWSHSREGLFLVYDYMCNGSLDKWIHQNSDVTAALSWNARRFILAGVASGLEYLHEGWVQCVLHRDIKSSNVMLDADFNACLGDFGLARLIDHNKLQRTTLLAGTLGYMAPEMIKTGRATKETDVYAFGIMVLEVVCGRRPLDMQATDTEDFVLLDRVWHAHEAGSISKMADVRLSEVETSSFEDAEAAIAYVVPDVADAFEAKLMVANMLHLGLLCCLPDPSERPSMRAVNRWFQSSEEGAVERLPPLPASKPHYAHPAAPSIISQGTSSSQATSSSQSSGFTGQWSTPSDTGSLQNPRLQHSTVFSSLLGP